MRYGERSSVDVHYGDVHLYNGSWPTFEQLGRNVTIVRVERRVDGVQLVEISMKSSAVTRGKGRVPLEVDAKVRVRVRFRELRLWKMDTKVRCHVLPFWVEPHVNVSISFIKEIFREHCSSNAFFDRGGNVGRRRNFFRFWETHLKYAQVGRCIQEGVVDVQRG